MSSAVTPAMPIAAASPSEQPSGTVASAASGTATCSAKVPSRVRPRPATRKATRRPSAVTPAPSQPAVRGSGPAAATVPADTHTSSGLTAARLTVTT